MVSYNRYVNMAELAFISSQFSSSAQYYDSAFRLVRYPPAIDVQNAVVADIANGNYNAAMTHSLLLARLGVGRNYFLKKTIFLKLHKEAGWRKLLDAAADYEREMDKKYGELRESLYHMEDCRKLAEKNYQKAAQSYEAAGVYAGIVDSLGQLLLAKFDAHGYPSEARIGVNISNDTVIAEPVFARIVAQSRMKPYQNGFEITYNNTFWPMLESAIDKGEIDVELALQIAAKDPFCDYRVPPVFSANCELLIGQRRLKADGAWNTGRQELGLASYEDLILKAKYQARNPGSPICIFPLRPGMTGISQIDDPNGETAKASISLGKINGCK